MDDKLHNDKGRDGRFLGINKHSIWFGYGKIDAHTAVSLGKTYRSKKGFVVSNIKKPNIQKHKKSSQQRKVKTRKNSVVSNIKKPNIQKHKKSSHQRKVKTRKNV